MRKAAACALLVATACAGAATPAPWVRAPLVGPRSSASASAPRGCPPFTPAVLPGCTATPDPEPELAGALEAVRERVAQWEVQALNAAESFGRPHPTSEALEELQRCDQLSPDTSRTRVGPLRDDLPIVAFGGRIPTDVSNPSDWRVLVARDGCTWRALDITDEPALYRGPEGLRVLVTHADDGQCEEDHDAYVMDGATPRSVWSQKAARADVGDACPQTRRIEEVIQGDQLVGFDVSSRTYDGTTFGEWTRQAIRWQGQKLPSPDAPR